MNRAWKARFGGRSEEKAGKQYLLLAARVTYPVLQPISVQYDSPIQSRPESISSTLYAKRSITDFNKTSGPQREENTGPPIYNGGYSGQTPIPAKHPRTPRLVPQGFPLPVPPDPNLPLIPRTPMTGFSNRSSANSSLRAERRRWFNHRVKGPRDNADDEHQNHVHFR